MNNNKVACMNISKKYGYDYWDEIENLDMVDIDT